MLDQQLDATRTARIDSRPRRAQVPALERPAPGGRASGPARRRREPVHADPEIRPVAESMPHDGMIGMIHRRSRPRSSRDRRIAHRRARGTREQHPDGAHRGSGRAEPEPRRGLDHRIEVERRIGRHHHQTPERSAREAAPRGTSTLSAREPEERWRQTSASSRGTRARFQAAPVRPAGPEWRVRAGPPSPGRPTPGRCR